MFKRLKKSVIDKNNSFLSNLTKKRVNKTPSKIIFPNRTNLAFANIIVNMNSTPSFRSIESWNNSYFNTDLYNNSFSNKTSSYWVTDISRNAYETKDDHSEILSVILNGILCLKSNDLMNYFFKLIEIITYYRDNNDKFNYIDTNNEINKDLLMIIYQIYFRIFPDNSFVYLLLKNDLKNGMKIFKKIHSVYILYILSGLSYINDKLKSKNTQSYKFLLQFIKKEKCNDLKCPVCINIENYEKHCYFNQKSPVFKIMDRKFKKNNIINKRIVYGHRIKKNIISISNDNIANSKRTIKNFNERDYYSNFMSERSKDKKAITSNTSKKDIFDTDFKKNYNSQMNINNEKTKTKLLNHSLIKNQIILKNQKIIQNQKKNNYLQKIDMKRYNTENNACRKKNLKRIGNTTDNMTIKLSNRKKNKAIKKTNQETKKFNNIMDIDDNNIINNNKMIDMNSANKNQPKKTKKIKIDLLTIPKIKNDKKISINLNNSEKKKSNNEDNSGQNEVSKSDKSLNESTKIIKDNINLIEKEIISFKQHNLYIKQQLEKIFNKNK